MARLTSLLGMLFVGSALVGCTGGGEGAGSAAASGERGSAAAVANAAKPEAVAAADAAKPAEDKSADWPQFRGPAGGVSSAKGLPATFSQTENIVYKTELPGAGTSSPIIVGSRIYLTYYTGFNVPRQAGKMEDLKLYLLCLNRADGKQIWSTEVAPKLPEQARIRDDHGYASSTPACDGDSLYVFFGKSGVFAFDLEGKQRWRADVGSGLSDWGSAASPLLYQNLVIINASVESQSLVAFDKKTGKEVWRAGNIREAWNTPILVPLKGGKTELAVGVQGKVLGFDPASGQQLWSCNNDIGWYIVPTMVSADGVIWGLGGRSGVAGLAIRAGGRGDVTKTHRLWTSMKGSNVSSPIIHQGHLYWMHEGLGVAYCAEALSGKIVYEERVGGRIENIYASPVLADGKIYYIARNGKVVVVAAKPTFEKLAINDLGDRSMFNASPAVAGNHLFIRSDTHLYCIGQK